MAEVLCIDDEPGVVELVELVLQNEGITVRGAYNGADGLAAIRERRPDAILLDIMMPDIDGWDLFKAIKADEALRDIPVIILTATARGQGSFDEIIARERAGVDDYITKPFTPSGLRTCLRRVLQSVSEAEVS
ncbi:MAG: response regulator [Anaerolineae bacterium]